RVRGSYAGRELVLAECQLFREVGAHQGHVSGFAAACQRNVDGQHRREAKDVVPPERSFDLGKVGFVQKAAIAGRLQIDAANFDVQSVFLRRHEQVRSVGPEFTIDLVADIGGNGDHRGGYRDA